MLTKSQLKSLLHYNPETGIFHRKYNTKSKMTGYLNTFGYLEIRVKSKLYLAHRLAWFYVHGEFPQNEIDHIDHDRSNNKINNLRDVTRIENAKNASLRGDSNSGVTGVTWIEYKNIWLSQIKHNYKTINLGTFKDMNEAIRVRKEAEIKYGFHVNHGL